MSKEGVELDGEVVWAGRLARTWISPGYARLSEGLGDVPAFRTGTLTDLFEVAADLLAPDEAPLSMFLIPARLPTLNAFVTRSPAGTPAVVVNEGLVEYLAVGVHLVMGMTMWRRGEYCPHFSDQDRIEALLQLGTAASRGMPAGFDRHGAASCLGTASHVATNDLHDTFCRLAVLFVFLHELGHLALGHLDEPGVPVLVETGPDVALGVSRVRARELEADAFSVARMAALVGSSAAELGLTDASYAVGCLLAVLLAEDLARGEPSPSHPSPLERWDHLVERMPPAPEGSLVASVGHLIAYLGAQDVAVS